MYGKVDAGLYREGVREIVPNSTCGRAQTLRELKGSHASFVRYIESLMSAVDNHDATWDQLGVSKALLCRLVRRHAHSSKKRWSASCPQR
jgi:hypothetical protein